MASCSSSQEKTFQFEMKVCLGTSVVPLFTRRETLHDPMGLVAAELEDVEWQCLSLRQKANTGWALQPLGVTAKGWRQYHNSLPILQELRQGIMDMKKSLKTQGSRMPMMPQYMVPLKIRDQVVIVRNHVTFLEMAFNKGEALEGLAWLMQQLKQDFPKVLKVAQLQEDDESDEDHEDEQGEDPEAHWYSVMDKKTISKTLEKVQSHERCKSATWCPSRVTLKVVRKDKSCKWVRIQGLLKRRKVVAAVEDENMALLEPVRTSFESAAAEALYFLEHQEEPVAAPIQDSAGDM